MSNESHPVGMMALNRLEALTDGVFSIVMTLLVFEISIPSVAEADLLPALFALWPQFVIYFISFCLLGIYWLGQRSQFNFIRHVDTTYHWLNIAFLATSALVPFTTGLLGHYPTQWVSVLIYGGNLIVIGVSLYAIWAYATHNHHLVSPDLSESVIRFGKQRCLIAPAFYFLAIIVAAFSTLASLIVFLFVPLLYILPSLQQFWRKFAFSK